MNKSKHISKMFNNRDILIVVPSLEAYGGISNYYRSIRSEMPNNSFYFERNKFDKVYLKILMLVFDYLKFIKILIFNNEVKLVQFSTSLDKSSVFRDSIYILISKFFKKKVVVFFRGWSKERATNVEDCCYFIFKRCFSKVDTFIILAKEVEEQLKEWGFKNIPIYFETTVVEQIIFEMGKIKRDKEIKGKEHLNILFIGRIEDYKGVFNLVKAFQLLPNRNSIKLDIVGDGSQFRNLKDYIQINKIDNVVLHGYKKGEEKAHLLVSSDIFILPSFAEGMPNSLLEAMGAKLPILTSAVGGIPDFFEEGRMGFYINPYDPKDISIKIEKMVSMNAEERLAIGNYNYNYAENKFSVNQVIGRLNIIYSEVIRTNKNVLM